MTELKLQNPYYEETITVKESLDLILSMLEWIERGNIQFLTLHQIEPEETVITISPKNFAKINYYDVSEVKNDDAV